MEYTNLSNTKIRLAPLDFTIAKPFSPIMSAVIPPRKSKSPEVVGRLSGVTAYVNPQPFPVFHQSRRWSMGIKCETTQIWCASRYIILCMYYLHSLYSSHRSLLCLASRGFRTPPEPEPKAGPKWNHHAILIPTGLCSLLEWGALPVLFHGEGLEGQACHYECATACMTLRPTNVKVSAPPWQLPESKATPAICWTNGNIYLLIFSQAYSPTRLTLLILRSVGDTRALWRIVPLISHLVLGKYYFVPHIEPNEAV